MERRFEKNSELKSQYTRFIHEYLALGHMKLCENTTDPRDIYLPHHCVFKPESTTTKIRVVFDASAKTNTGIALNDVLINGPTVQKDLLPIILRARKHKFMFTADVNKMYRQILVVDEHQHLQKIVWRDNSTDPVQTYQLKTITYGTKNAPFLATRTLRQIGIDNKMQYPDASKMIMEDFYVDDLISGCDDVNEAMQIQKDVINILNSAGMKLHKWSSNCTQIIEHLNSQVCGTQPLVEFKNNDLVKTLGIAWNPQSDQFHLSAQPLIASDNITKRHILSEIARVYDPIGFLGPIVIIGKIMMQDLWKSKVNWYSTLPSTFQENWVLFQRELPNINSIKVPRYVMNFPYDDDCQLHGFVDASKKAYGAVVYIRTRNGDGIYDMKMLCSKSRVSPIKQTDITKLELCATVLLAKLVTMVIEAMQINFEKVILWSDSTIALNWLRKESYRLPTFIANRVAEVQSLTNEFEWRHIPSEHNSADVISRGQLPSELITNQLWWSGPFVLQQTEEQWPSHEIILSDAEIPELRAVTMLSVEQQHFDVINRISSFRKLQRIMVYVNRFIKICRKQRDKKSSCSLIKPDELSESTLCLIKIVQLEDFRNEIKQLTVNDSGREESKSKKKSNIRFHNIDPFLDEHSIIRVGGRLRNANLPYAQKHPALLSSKSRLTKLIIRAYHEEHGHAAQNLLLAILRNEFWISDGKATIRNVIRKCVKCFHHNPTEVIQPMGQLPKPRITQSNAFEVTGVDYAGPINFRLGHKRSKTSQKGYIALFVCFVTKSVHLELISDLSSAAFLAGFSRFVNRRGNCAQIYSDNGTTFIGANSELKKLDELLKNCDDIEAVNNVCTQRGITWNFIPPRAPNFGGLWEAGIKSMKNHLKKLQSGMLMTYEELLTILVQIEGLLNSRPLTPVSNDPNDFAVLTPAHFLIGRPITAIAEQDLTETPSNRLTRWKHIQQIKQHIWKRWQQEYLGELQSRKKWSKLAPTNIEEGMLVLIKEDHLPPLTWRLARIKEIHKGLDGIVRVVTLRTPSNEIKRSVSKICPLPFYDTDE